MRIHALLLLAPIVCLAQAPTGPHISFDALHYDFGKIPGDAKVNHRFKVTNTGLSPLNITRLNPSCGCTSTVLGKWTLAPGESTEIEVTFNPAGFRGVSRKSIQVVSDDPATPTATLTFEADVVREIMPSTDSVFFQDVVRSAPRKASVKLVSGTDRPVGEVKASAPGAPYLKLTTRKDGNDAWVELTLDGSKVPAGKQVGADAIFVRTTNPKVPSITLTVQWEMRASISADPVRVAWLAEAGKPQRSKVALTQVDGKPFRILSTKTSNPLVQVRVEGPDKAAARQEVEVTLAAEARPGLYNEKVTFALDDPDQPELELRVSASLTKAPDVTPAEN